MLAMNPLPVACSALLWLTGSCLAQATAPAADPWHTILGPARGSIPAPREHLEWLTDLDAAQALAQREDRPLFVTFRCLPCKQCADFDRDVLEGGPLLEPLLRQFVTVRLTDAMHIDLDRFPIAGFQDFDLSWWGWFLSPAGRVYGIFGGRDEAGDTTRISVAALANSLRRVLAHHYDPRRAGWDVDGPAPSGTPRSPRALPGFASWTKRHGPHQDCLHCHQLGDVLRQPALDAGTFRKPDDLEVWPLPEKIGLRLDRDDGLAVTQVEPDSPAARAGLRIGDRLAAAGGRRLFGQADFRGALHRAPRQGELAVYWRRAQALHRGVLTLAGDWRRTVLDWRMSVSQGNVARYPGFWSHPVPDAERRKLGLALDTMAIRPWFGRDGAKTAAHRAGLRPAHIITAVDGAQPNVHGRAFLVWLMLRKEPGDEVELTVTERGGGTRTITFRL